MSLHRLKQRVKALETRDASPYTTATQPSPYLKYFVNTSQIWIEPEEHGWDPRAVRIAVYLITPVRIVALPIPWFAWIQRDTNRICVDLSAVCRRGFVAVVLPPPKKTKARGRAFKRRKT